MEVIFFVLYGALSYWSAGKTIYANKILFGRDSDIFFKKLIPGMLFGPILIPIAIIKTLLGR